MTDKTPIYSMVPPPYPVSSKQWLSRAALVLSSGGVLVAMVALLLVVQQGAQLQATQTQLEASETSIRLLEARLDQLTTLAINGELFEDIEEDIEEEEDIDELHLLSRPRRQATSEDVQIYNEPFKQNLTASQTALLHYSALQSDALLENLTISSDAAVTKSAGLRSQGLAQNVLLRKGGKGLGQIDLLGKGLGLAGNSIGLDTGDYDEDEDIENSLHSGLIHYPKLQGRGQGLSAVVAASISTADDDDSFIGNSITDVGAEEYESEEKEAYLVPVLTKQDTKNNIRPHHRLSSVWPKHTKFPSATGPEHYSSPYRSGEVSYKNIKRQPTVERRSRVKQTSTLSYLNPGLTNTVLPPVAKVSQPKPKARTTTYRPEELNLPVAQAPKTPVRGLKTLGKKTSKPKGEKKTGKRVTKNQTRRRRTGGLTVAHYVAQPASKVNGISNEGWTQAVWMDKLGLDKKYHLKRGVVIVKEAGLYYIYAQMLYQTGRFGTGYQVMIDGVPLMECSITQASPSDSCHTSGVTYLPYNAEIRINNKESFMRPVDQTRNSFFGLIKLMDAPRTTEELMGR